MVAVMRPPRYGWLLAGLGSLALVALVSLVSIRPVETLITDLRHRSIARPGPVGEAVTPPAIGMNVFLEQEVEPAKRQQSLELLRRAGVTWLRQELPWEQIEPVAKGQTVDPNFGDSSWSKFDDIVD